MVNRVVIVGRITKKPELRTITANTCVTSFHVAVDNPKNSNGQKTTSFIPVTVWNNQANNVCKYLDKGSLVGVDGSLRQIQYTSKDGNNVNTYEVLASSITFLDSKNAVNKENTAFDNSDKKKNDTSDTVDNNENDNDVLDELPF